jgi:hypothetical protein
MVRRVRVAMAVLVALGMTRPPMVLRRRVLPVATVAPVVTPARAALKSAVAMPLMAPPVLVAMVATVRTAPPVLLGMRSMWTAPRALPVVMAAMVASVVSRPTVSPGPPWAPAATVALVVLVVPGMTR